MHATIDALTLESDHEISRFRNFLRLSKSGEGGVTIHPDLGVIESGNGKRLFCPKTGAFTADFIRDELQPVNLQTVEKMYEDTTGDEYILRAGDIEGEITEGEKRLLEKLLTVSNPSDFSLLVVDQDWENYPVLVQGDNGGCVVVSKRELGELQPGD